MQTELIEKIIHLPIAERVEIIERISRSLREDLREKMVKNHPSKNVKPRSKDFAELPQLKEKLRRQMKK